jgi:hypothetical protein
MSLLRNIIKWLVFGDLKVFRGSEYVSTLPRNPTDKYSVIIFWPSEEGNRDNFRNISVSV